MRKYELLYIIRPTIEDDAKKALIERFNNVIAENGGTVEKTTDMGKRRFAYEINKMREGHYVLLNVTAEPKAMQEVERLMKISDDVIRQMSTKNER